MSTSTTMDRAGRVVLPKAVRDELRLSPGDTLEIALEGDELTLRPRRAATPLQKERGVWVLRTGEPLTSAQADEAIRGTRARRSRRLAGEAS